jgi:hypothetical protein
MPHQLDELLVVEHAGRLLSLNDDEINLTDGSVGRVVGQWL